jgi:hypothetical protein
VLGEFSGLVVRVKNRDFQNCNFRVFRGFLITKSNIKKISWVIFPVNFNGIKQDMDKINTRLVTNHKLISFLKESSGQAQLSSL